VQAPLATVVLTAALILTPSASAASEELPPDTDGTPKTTDHRTVKWHRIAAESIIRYAYRHRSWQAGHEWNSDRRKRVARHQNKIHRSPEDRFKITSFRISKRNSFKDWKKGQKRKAQRESADPANWTPNGWAIPAHIVSCESGGSWTAYNSSGALGPYQLLGKGAPWPVTTYAQAQVHHQIAANLWAGGSGIGHWAACA
jgi:hypothetical protein